MKKLLISSIAILMIASALTACKREDVGMVAGGVVGGAAGHALTNSPVGTVAGAVGGAYIGRQLAH